MADKRLWAARNTSSDRSVFIGGSFVKVLLDTSRNRRAGNGAIRGSFDSLKQHPRPVSCCQASVGSHVANAPISAQTEAP